MKTKLFFGVTLCLLFSSCVKDYIGHGTDKIELTAENNIYEGDLYMTFIDSEILIVATKIEGLEKIIKSGQATNQTEEDLKSAKIRIDMLQKEANSTLLPDWLFLRIPRPKPPCPQPQNCDLFGFDFITSLNETQLKSILILDAEGNEIGGTTGNQSTLPKTSGRALVDDFMINDYSGPVTVKVFTESSKRLENTYSFESSIE